MQRFLSHLQWAIFASRWFLAPIYISLVISLIFIALKALQEIVHFAPLIFQVEEQFLILFILRLVDLALSANLLLMVIFAGYENFVSKISIADAHEDRPGWMGKVGFGELKLKLVASFIAISGINLLTAFLDVTSKTDRELKWLIAIHIAFIISGLILAIIEYISGITKKEQG